MITKREIRVGNWIYIPDAPTPLEFLPSDFLPNECSGVPLTKEILLKNQFTTYHANDGEWRPEYHIKIGIDGDFDTFALTPVTSIVDEVVSEVGFQFVMYHDETSHMRPTAIIKYVHELQNLVFALYKIELKIKL